MTSRTIACLLGVSAALVVGVGCMGQSKQAARELPRHTVVSQGLGLTLVLPNRQFTTGQTIQARVIAENLTSQPITINSPTGALVVMRLLRHTGLFWQDVRSFPESTTMVLTTWTLRGGQQREFIVSLRVEPNWPTQEVLRLTAELNGRNEQQTGLDIVINPR